MWVIPRTPHQTHISAMMQKRLGRSRRGRGTIAHFRHGHHNIVVYQAPYVRRRQAGSIRCRSPVQFLPLVSPCWLRHHRPSRPSSSSSCSCQNRSWTHAAYSSPCPRRHCGLVVHPLIQYVCSLWTRPVLCTAASLQLLCLSLRSMWACGNPHNPT